MNVHQMLFWLHVKEELQNFKHMPTYRDGDEEKFFPAVIAGLLALGFGLAALIYSLLQADPASLNDKLGLETVMTIEEENGELLVNPGPGLATPSSAPHISQPVAAPN